MLNITYRNLHDGKCEAIIYLGDWDIECASEIMPTKNTIISKVRIVLASGIIIAMTASQFVSAVSATEKGSPFSAALFDDATTSEMRKFVQSAKKSFGIVSPDYFKLDNSGNLLYSTISGSFSSEMHQSGTKVLPTLTYTGSFSEDIMEKGLEIGEEIGRASCRERV